MKKVKLHIYSYGIVKTNKVADFGKNSHDAIKCMKHLNDSLILSHGELPENIFYYLTYTLNGRDSYFVDYTGSKDLYPNDLNYSKKLSPYYQK